MTDNFGGLSFHLVISLSMALKKNSYMYLVIEDVVRRLLKLLQSRVSGVRNYAAEAY